MDWLASTCCSPSFFTNISFGNDHTLGPVRGARAEATVAYAAANLSRLSPVLATFLSSFVSATKYA
eukprot:5417104-Lingulodinium_polyedra.AAC.1